MKKTSLIIFLFISYFFLWPRFLSASVLAVKYSLVAPNPPYTRGQTIRFTINIDTQGATIKTGQIGMTYETQYLEFVSTTPGNAMTTVSTSQLEGGKLLLSGENTTGFSDAGVFAYVDLKLIATSAGETELCVLWAPSITPTTIPTTTIPTTTAPTSPPTTGAPTSVPQPTKLPTSGEVKKTNGAVFFGFIFIITFSLFRFLNKNVLFKKSKKT